MRMSECRRAKVIVIAYRLRVKRQGKRGQPGTNTNKRRSFRFPAPGDTAIGKTRCGVRVENELQFLVLTGKGQKVVGLSIVSGHG